MPCALTSLDNYPDYLKNYLKEIAASNDENLKICACQLKTPLNNEGCPIVDEDGKVGAFPFCVTSVNNPQEAGYLGSIGSGLTLKQAMEIYWKGIGIKYGSYPGVCANDGYCGTVISNFYDPGIKYFIDRFLDGPYTGGHPICGWEGDEIGLSLTSNDHQGAPGISLGGLYYDGVSFYFPFNNDWGDAGEQYVKYKNNIFEFAIWDPVSPPNLSEIPLVGQGFGSPTTITVEIIYGNIRNKYKIPNFTSMEFSKNSPYIYYFRG